VEKGFVVDPKLGVSIKQLVDNLNDFGIAATAYRVSPSALGSTPLPAVAVLRTDTPELHHFVTIVANDNDRVHYIDGTTYASVETSLSNFSDRYEGILFGVRENRLFSSSTYVFLFGSTGLALSAIGLYRRRRQGTNKSVEV